MKLNVKVRFKNKAFVAMFATLIVTFVYQMLGLFGVVPAVSEETVINIISTIINVLAIFGVFVDPTTPGVSDSARAMTYGTDNDVRKTEG